MGRMGRMGRMMWVAVVALLAANAWAVKVNEEEGLLFYKTGSGQFPTYDSSVRMWMTTDTQELVFQDQVQTSITLAQIVTLADDGTTETVALGLFSLDNTVLSTTTNTANMILRPYAGKYVEIDATRLIPTGAASLGYSTNRWATIYGTVGDFSTQVNTNVIRPYSSSGNLDLLDDDSDAGSGGLRINEGGTVTVPGRFSGDLLPSTNLARDLGSSSLVFQDVYAGTATLTTAKPGNLSLSANAMAATNDSGVTVFDNAGNGMTLADGGAITLSHGAVAGSSAVAANKYFDVQGSGNTSKGLRFLRGVNVDGWVYMDANEDILISYMYTDLASRNFKIVRGSGQTAVATWDASGNMTAAADLTISGAIKGSRHSYHFYDATVTVTAVGTIAAQWVGDGVDEDYSIIMPHAGSVVGLSVMGNITETNADTEYVGVFIDGATTQADDTAIPEYLVEIDAGSTGIKSAYGTQARGTDTFTAGQKLTPCLGGQDMTAADNYTMTNVHVVLEVVFND